MAGLNKVMLIGNLGRDPDIRYTKDRLAVVTFSIATSEKWADKNTGEPQEKTEWHRIVVFGKRAETCERYLSKGSRIYIEGRLQTRSWEKEGQTHYVTEIIANNFMFLNSGQDKQSGNNNQKATGAPNLGAPAPDFQGPAYTGMSGDHKIPPEEDIPY